MNLIEWQYDGDDVRQKYQKFLKELRDIWGNDEFYLSKSFPNPYGEYMGWEKIDLSTGQITGYEVTCWSSSLLGLGHCACNNHEPGYEIDRLASYATLEDIKALIEEENKKLQMKKDFITFMKANNIPGILGDRYTTVYPYQYLRINYYCKNGVDGTCSCNSHSSSIESELSIESEISIEELTSFLHTYGYSL